MSIYQSYHLKFTSHRGSLRIVLHFTKLLLLSQLLLMLRGVAVEGQTGTPIPLMGDDIQQIVDAHNLFRSIVDPPASNMQGVVSFSSLFSWVNRDMQLPSLEALNCEIVNSGMACKKLFNTLVLLLHASTITTAQQRFRHLCNRKAARTKTIWCS